MAIDFNQFLTAEQKAEIIAQRITQFAAEAFQHELNKQVAQSIGDTEAVAQADAALLTLEEAINTYQNAQVN